MIIENVITFLSVTILIYFLARRYVKRYAPENIFLCILTCLSFGIYLYIVNFNYEVHILIQVLLIINMFVIPIIFVLLQYNNIIISRKLLYNKAKFNLYLGDYNKSIELINKLIEKEGRKAEYYYMLGMSYNGLEDFINARDCFSLAVERDKRDYKSYYELGKILDETNKKDTAIIMYNNALRIKPDFYDAAESLGICFTSQGKFKTAIKIYENALEYHPKSFELYYNIAMIYMELGDYQKSEENFIKSADLRSSLYSAYFNVGYMNYIQGDYDKAIKFFNSARSSTLYGGKAYYKLASIYSIQKEYIKALSCLEYAACIDKSYIHKAKDEMIFENMRDKIIEFEEAFENSNSKNYKKIINFEDEKKKQNV